MTLMHGDLYIDVALDVVSIRDGVAVVRMDGRDYELREGRTFNIRADVHCAPDDTTIMDADVVEPAVLEPQRRRWLGR
jgi:hypothetical protein